MTLTKTTDSPRRSPMATDGQVTRAETIALDDWMSGFRLSVFRMRFRSEDTLRLPPYKGAVVRGAMGQALRRLLCTTRLPECVACPVLEGCLFPQLFQTEALSRGRPWPPPYVLTPPLLEDEDIPPGTRLTCRLVLVGKATTAFPFFAAALRESGRRGWGRQRGTLLLEGIDQLTGRDSALTLRSQSGWFRAEESRSAAAFTSRSKGGDVDRLILDFLTPMRFKQQGRLCSRPQFDILIRRLLERFRSLAKAFQPDLPDLDPNPWIGLAGRVELIESELGWMDWRRYSSRQRSPMRLGGFLGRARYRGPVTAFLPLLDLAQLLHIGKGASFGLGRVQVIHGDRIGD